MSVQKINYTPIKGVFFCIFVIMKTVDSNNGYS